MRSSPLALSLSLLTCAGPSLLACQPSAPAADAPAIGTGTPAAEAGKHTVSAATAAPAAVPVPAPVSASTWVARTPAELKANGNHLKGAGSVYLQQHAHNPLEWYPWGEEALQRARLEDKPIFLSIGYSSCHWCHVMEHEVFEHDDVAEFMNANFVCIKVDREERPDLDAIYMDAVVKMTGRGGWPMSVALTPSLKPFWGGTYFPKARFMPLMRQTLKKFKESRNEVEADGDKIYADIAALPSAQPGSKLRPEVLQALAKRAVGAIDMKWGGVRGRMKFPTPSRWKFLIQAYRKWGDEALGAGLRLTLDKMADGGIHDQVGGGFHRYTTEDTWLIPHFEKMLYDNGQLAALYLDGAAAFQEPRYVEVARRTLDFMLAELWDPEGGFYASYDADSGGEEGTFYVWSPADLVAVAGKEDGRALALLMGVDESGNFEHGKSVVTLRASHEEVAEATGRSVANIAGLFERWRPELYEVRAKRVWPGLDKKLVTAWNGLAIGAMARGYAVTGEPRYREAAEKAAERMWTLHRRPEGGMFRVSNGGKAEHLGILDDYTFLAGAFVDLFEATGELKHLERAETLLEEADARFKRSGGGWLVAEATDKSLLMRHFEPYDSVRPSGNSAFLDAQLRLAALTGDTAAYDLVGATLDAYAPLIQSSGFGMGGWASVALRNAGPFYEVIIAGDEGDRRTAALQALWRVERPAWAVHFSIPAAGPSEAQRKALPPLFGKTGKDGGPLAYVCVKGSCKQPTADPKVFAQQLNEGWTH